MRVGVSEGLIKTLEGKTLFVIEVDDDNESLAALDGEKVFFEVEKWSDKKSDRARKYLWELCTLIGRAVGTSKDAVYKMMLSHYGTYTDIVCDRASLSSVKALFRHSEIVDEDFIEYEDKVTLRGYFGVSGYTQSDMNKLLNGVVSEAKDLGIETLPPNEVERLVQLWKSAE